MSGVGVEAPTVSLTDDLLHAYSAVKEGRLEDLGTINAAVERARTEGRLGGADAAILSMIEAHPNYMILVGMPQTADFREKVDAAAQLSRDYSACMTALDKTERVIEGEWVLTPYQRENCSQYLLEAAQFYRRHEAELSQGRRQELSERLRHLRARLNDERVRPYGR